MILGGNNGGGGATVEIFSVNNRVWRAGEMCQLFDMTIGFALFIPIKICKGGELAILHGLFPFAADLSAETFIIMSSTLL